MFSSKFLSGANPLSAVSSAVNKFGLFGDDGEGDKNQKPQQGTQQPAAGTGKGPPTQQPQKNQGQNGQNTTGQSNGGPQPAKGQQGTAEPGGQKGQQSKSVTVEQASKTGLQQKEGPTKMQQKDLTKSDVVSKSGAQQGQTKVGGSPKPGEIQGAAKPGQQGAPIVGGQTQGAPKLSQQGTTRVGAQMQGSPKPGSQQGSPTVGRQQQGVPKPDQQGAPSVGGQMQGSPKPGQKGAPSVGGQSPGPPKPGQQGSPKPPPQQGPPKSGVAGSPGQQRTGSSSQTVAKAGAKSKICSVCNTTELNMHTKDPPNYKTCTQCKMEVCSLCGFSPPDSNGKEWLCLTCQIQRAQGPDLSGPSMKKPSPSPNQKSPVPAKKDISQSSSPLKSQPVSGPTKSEPAKGQKVPPETPKVPQKSDTSPQPGRKPVSEPPQQSGGLFGFGASKTDSSTSKESVTGKMFGFGSSFLSSASTLISSDETKTTPPVSPKVQPANQAKMDKKTEQDKRPEQPTSKGPAKPDKSDMVKDKVVLGSLKDVPFACPICHSGLNQASGKPNYSMCTDCRGIVCNQCGFNPSPNVKEGKEWLCLNCQVKHAAGGGEPEVKKIPSTQPAPQKTSMPASPQRKPPPAKTDATKVSDKDSHKEPTQPPGLKPIQDSQLKKADQTAPRSRSASPAPQQQDSGGGLFGFSATKSQPDPVKPTESVTGKMFGFGSSIFSSASTLITSAVQDESKTTPPISPKISKEAKSSPGPAAKKQETEKKAEEAKGLPKEQAKPPTGKSVCPLCKVQLNVGSKDPPNYNTCTECKSTVCNQCGFNPMPNVKEVKEWLCLNCQMQRAVSASEQPGMPTKKPQASPNKASTPAGVVKKEPPVPDPKDIPLPTKTQSSTTAGSPQRRPQPAQQLVKPEKEKQRQGSPTPGPKAQQVTKPTESKPPQGAPGDPKPQAEVTKSSESIGGKMFGFGSSIFSSASSMISSAVQDESKTTPPVSPKMPTAKTTISPQTQRKDEEKKPGQVNQPNATSLPQAKVEKASSQPMKEQTAPTASKAAPSNCPLCKIQLNVGSKEPPNYSRCTQCKETVCNQCGFNPVPNMTEVKQWLCLNCQMQRALAASEDKAAPMKSPNVATKVPNPIASKQAETLKKDEKGHVDSKRSSAQEVQFKKTPSPAEPHPKADNKVIGSTMQKDQKPSQKPEPKKDQVVADTSSIAVSESKPTESVTGKMFGFGSSIFSSASTLISSAVQDESRTTPPTSRKMSASAQASPKLSPGPKVAPKQPTQTGEGKESDSKSSSPVPIKKTPTEPQPKSDAKDMENKVQQDQTPPQKIEQQPKAEAKLNQVVTDGKKDTSSKTVPESKATETVTNKMFGFGSSIFSSASTLISSAVQDESRTTPPVSRKMSTPGQASPKASPGPKVTPNQPTGSPKRHPKATQKSDEEQPKLAVKPHTQTEQIKESADLKSSSTVPAKAPAAPQPTPDGKDIERKIQHQKPLEKTEQPKLEPKKEQVDNRQKDTSPKMIPEAKTTESVTGKMFGFGSSIFSSASTLISSVQDESRTTPPASRKMSAPAQASPKSSPGPKVVPTQSTQTEERKEGADPKSSSTVPIKIPVIPQPKSDAKDMESKIQQDQKTVQPKSEPEKDQVVTDGLKDQLSKIVPEAKTTESTTGKMFGFGSSIFSSASTLISSVQDESRTTPPASRKMSAPAQTSPKSSPGSKVTPKQSTQTEERKENVDPKSSSTVPDKTPGKPEPKSDATEIESKSKQDQKPQQKAEQSKSEPKKDQVDTGQKDTPPKIIAEAKTTESATGKMFGFGSSIFHSASTLISSVQDDSRTTPPASRKMSAPAQASPKSSPGPKVAPKQPTPTGSPKRDPKIAQQTDEGQKKSVPLQGKRDITAPPQMPMTNACPLCKSKLNIGSKDAPNYKTCTECMETVCNQCGFSPVPRGEVKEWLCLNCQMKRAATVPEPPQVIKSPSKAPEAGQKTDIITPEKKDIPEPTQKLKKTLEPQPQKVDSLDGEKKEVLDQKAPQTKPQKTPDQGVQSPRRQSKEQESGGIFGFGGPKAQSESGKPAESVGGKMFGFGSSIFNSASTLITSVAQEQPKTTPPVSPKLSPAKTSPAKEAMQKPGEQKKEDAKTSLASQGKVDKGPLQPSKPVAVPQTPTVKPGQSTCPLCKAQLNINTKDPPNYSNCTECKNCVCKQCGFNPSPNDLSGKEWLCLNCQMQRALSVTEAPNKLPEKAQKKEPTTINTSQNTPSPAVEKTAEVVVTKSKQKSPTPAQKKPQEPVKIPDQARKQSTASAKSQEDTGQSFDFGGKAQPETKPTESVSGKMFGFGSSLFSSASTLIASAVQDQPSTTPPVSPKMSPKDLKNTSALKSEPQKKPDQPQQTKIPPVTKAEKTSPAPPKKTISQDAAKLGENACPLCKSQLNIGSTEAPNYNSCTECKNRVCNQCGFSPLPSGSQTKEWLCLTCQMQRALKQSEEVQPPLKKPLTSPNKVPTPAVAPEDRKDPPPTQKAKVPEKIQKDLLQQQPEDAKAPSKISTPDTPASVREKEVPKVPKDTIVGTPPKAALSEAGMEKKVPSETSTPPKAPESKELKKEQQSKPTDKIQSQSDKRKDSKTEESGGFFGFGSPKSQRSASVVSEPVSGKVLGFGSSLFSSASSLITSAVKDESRTTPPSTRKMSAPMQASDKTSPSKVSPKPSPPVSPKVIPAKDTKAVVAQMAVEQKTEEKEVKAAKEVPKPDSPKPVLIVGPTSCPLCKVELNRNYNTCTQCKTEVCNKCGFSPMPTVSEVKEWLCLNCQMQRALGASEPPGLPMMKPSPKKMVSPTPPEKESVTEPVNAKKEVANKPEDEENKLPATSTPLEKAPPLQPEKSAPIAKPSVLDSLPSQKPIPSGPSPPQGLVEVKQSSDQKVTTAPPTSTTLPVEGKEQLTKLVPVTPVALEGPAEEKSATTAPKSGPVEENEPKPMLTEVFPSAPKGPEVVKPPKEEHPKPSVKPAAPPVEATTELPSKPTTTKPSPLPPKEPVSEQPPKPSVKPSALPVEGKATSEQSPKQLPATGKPVLSEPPPKPVAKSVALPGPGQVKTTPQQPPSPKLSSKPPTDTKGPSAQAGKPGEPAAKTVPSTAAQAKPAQPSVQPAKQEPGGFFGFGGSKPQPTDHKPAESVTGKMFGFGSSFLSSASNLISSAVQEESKTTPPTPRKMSTAQVSPKATPPASPKTVPPGAQKVDEKKPQEKAPSAPVKVNKVTSEPPRTSPPTKGPAQIVKYSCPLCKVELNMGSKDSPNYNKCTECKKTVCNQCGFNPMPNVTEIKEWLCLDCQMKRALGPTESTGVPALKQKTPSKEQDKPLTQKEKSPDAQVKKEIISTTPPKKEVPKVEASPPPTVPEAVSTPKGSLPKSQAKDTIEKQPPVGKPAQPTPPMKADAKEALPNQEAEKPPPQQPSKPATPAQPPKQESGGFFGFGSPKTQPKTETVTGKRFGFGSSFLSSASTLITSAIQDEPKTTPLVSPKMVPAKPKPGEKPEQPLPAKATAPVEKNVDKVLVEPSKDKEVTAKAAPSTCPLCKVDLNVGSKDSPNYNTCTECKKWVCNLCGFNPMPHTAAKEWLCLNCQTQRALLGQLGDPGKMPQPAPALVKAENQAAPPATKPQPTPTETKPIPPAVKPKPETSPKPQTPPPKIKTETKAFPASEKFPDSKPVPPAKPIGVIPEKKLVEAPKEDIEGKKEAEKPVVSVRDITKKYEPTEKTKAEVAVSPAPATPTKAIVAPVSTAPKSEVAEVVPVAQKKPSEVITLPEDTKPTKAEAKMQELLPKKKVEPISAEDSEAKGAEITKPVVVKADKDFAKEPAKEEQQPSTTLEQAKVKTSPLTTTVQPKEQEEKLPQILPITKELKDTQVVSDANENTIKQDEQLPGKEEVKTERRRLSFQAMEESSESELTPSPKIQRRRLRVTRISSSSEDMKTESADSSGEDEEFLRKQILDMRDDEQMSLSEDDKEKEAEDMVREIVVDNAAPVTKPFQPTGDGEGTASMVKSPQTTTSAVQESKEPVFKKATPAMRQRQSTDEEVESITESLSKGSSSVQASSFTPGSSPTSASSIEEDSDSSPSHRKATDKQHKKGKHRQPTQPLPTIEDSSEEERLKDEERSWKDKDEDVSSSEELRHVTVVSDKTSRSDRSASVESMDRQAVQRGRKPSPTVIPFTPEPVQETMTKPLKSADEAYEEILLKAKAIPGESPPDIEPMFGGMPIEDYLYESLVEEPEKICGSEELTIDVSEPAKKLRSPEEVYEEMMLKKRELMMIEQELQEAQIWLEASAAAEPESCVVTVPTEEPSSPPLADEGDEVSTDMQVKKKKRPAPPRPSEPPKRTDGVPILSHPTGISFVRPMLPQDPSLAKALFPIPHLKITQCSSGEEEEDSLADEYGVGMSSDITPSDDSDAKEASPPLSESAEMEPIRVVCEIPEGKPIPTPISAPELTSTPSPVSTVSPPTSPATPESSLATSSSSYQAQTPPSLDSTPISTPTPPTSVVTQSPPGTTMSAIPQDFATDHALSTVIVTIPDVVQKDQAKAKPSVVDSFANEPTIIQMPDLVSSPSKMPVETSAVTQVTAVTMKPTTVCVQTTTQTVPSVVGPAVTSQAHSQMSVSYGSPVIVQMPDLVSAAAPVVSAFDTIPSQAQTAVVHSVPVQAAVSSASPLTQVPTPTVVSTTIVKKKVPPPPPPRSTSVSLPDDRLQQRVPPAITTVTAATPKSTQPMQSVVVDIQPRVDAGADTTQLVTPTRQGHVMIIVPSKENASLQIQTQNSIATTSLPPTVQTITQVTVSAKISAPPVPPKPVLTAKAPCQAVDTVEITVADTPPPAPSTLPKPSVSPKPIAPSVSTTTTTITTTAIITPVPVTTSAPSQTAKPPPPIPPKPVSIPAGLVFSHKPGESVKPPYAIPKAATLPRTKEPPNALSLSITRPVESKSGATSPKSPVSPRYAKCKETYVVITLPSEPPEPGSPPEGITVVAPVRRGSTPATKVSEVRATPTEQKTTEILTTKAMPRRASLPTVRYPSPTPAPPIVAIEHLPSKMVSTETQEKKVLSMHTVHSVVDAALPSKDMPIQVQSVAIPIKKPYMQLVEQKPITQPLPAPEVIILSSEPVIPIQPQTVQVTAKAQPITTEMQPMKEPQAPLTTVQLQQFAAPQPVDVYLNMQDTDIPASTGPQVPQVESYIEIQKEHNICSEVTTVTVNEPDIHTVAGLPQVAQPSLRQTPVVTEMKDQAVILMPPPTAAEVMSVIQATVPETTPSSMLIELTQPTLAPNYFIEDSSAATAPLVMQPPTPPLEVIALPYEKLTGIKTEDVRSTTIQSAAQPQTVIPIEVILTNETTTRRRSSITSVPQPIFVTSQTVPYEAPAQILKTEEYASTCRESIIQQQLSQKDDVVYMSTERDVSIDMPERSEPKPVFISEYDHTQMEAEMFGRRSSIPTRDIQGVPGAPVTITKIQQESIESQEIRGQEKVVSSMSHVYSSQISTSGHPPESMPSLVTQVVTTEVQRTTVSVVHERIPQTPPPNVAITIQPELVRAPPSPKQNGRIYPVDVIDLRKMRDGVKMTEQGMDLTPPESCRQSFSSDSSGRQITAVQPEIVNLSAQITPSTTLAVVTDSITIVTCTATIASYTPAEKPLDLQGSVTSSPLPLTTYKPFEPLAQIVYKPVSAITPTTVVTSTLQDTPMNLSYGAIVSSAVKPPTSPSAPVISIEANGAIDLSNYKPMRAIAIRTSTSPGVTTTVIEDDDIPIDLTAGRSVCCDVIYKLPFPGSCRTQPAVTTQPDSQYQQESTGLYNIKGMNGMKVSLSETNIPEVALVPYDPTKHLDYLNGSSDSAIDLTATKLPAGKPLDYTSKAAGAYPGMATSPYGQSATAGFGVNSVIRTSDGMVYTSVAAPVPSTYAITTQPGSIFSTTLSPVSLNQNQALVPYQLIPTTDPGQIIPYDTGLPKELLPTALADIITGYQEMYSDTTLEAIAASLDALATSPIFPGLDSTKMAQYQMEREFLELEKLKQICLAEELEWERQEIQRYREQEQLMVQRELEELQTLKQQLLLQQEEEHHAHMVAQQETYAQQKEQLQQIQQLQLQLQRQLDEHYGTNTAHLLEAKYAGVGDSGQYWPVKDESTTPAVGVHLEGSQDQLNIKKLQADQDVGKKIIDSGVHTDDEDSEKQTTSSLGRRKKAKRTSDSSPPTDDEDDWDAPTKSRRRSRKHSSEGKHGSKVSSIAIQTVAEISVQTDHSGTIKKPNVQMDTKVEIIKHISAPENSQRGGSLSCQTDRHGPMEVGYSTHLTTDGPCKTKVFYSPVSPLSPEKSLGGQRMLMADPNRFSSGPRSLKPGQKSLSDPKSLSPTTDDRMGYYGDGYSGRGSPSSTGKKVKRTLPDPPPEDESLSARSGYSTNSARRRLARSTTMARAKILQDIDKELDLVERESSKLRKKQAELDEEEKEIDAKLRYLEMGINRRKEALLQEREKRERAYLQGVAEERDYMSDSEISNIREERGEGLERPRTAPQSEFDQFIPPQTEADSQYNTLTSPYSHYAQYVPQTQTTSPYTQQGLYQQQSLYHQQVSPYQNVPTLSLSQAQPSTYQHALLLQQGKQRQTTLSDLEPKIGTNYEVIRNQPLLIVPTSSESGYGVAPLGSKFASLDLRLGLEERSMASSPMSSISADSFYADIDHHNARNYVLIEDIGELTKASSGLGSTGFSLPDKELSKADRLLRAAEVRRTAEMADFLGSSRLQGYSKGEEDTMEEPYELKLLKQQIKQEFRRGTEGLEHLTGLGLPQYIHSDPTFRHFPKGEKYSIGRLTLEKQAAKQLPAAVLYQKQMKNKKAVLDPKAISKCSPIQESRDLEPDFASYMGSGASSVTNLAARARLLQDEITFGLRKNLAEQQKYLGSSLGANLASSLNLGQSLGLGAALDGTYPSGSRSRPSSRPSSVYGLDLSIKRDLSSSSLRLKPEGEVLDAAFAPGVARTKPTSLPISQSRGRIPIVAQNSEEESPLSPVGQPMGMARASAGPLPPISADSRDQFGSSHSLPEVQQHMREESRTRGYDRDIAFIMDDLQGAMSDSEAYHLRREDTDWFDKPREGHPQSGHVDRRQMKLVPYAFPHARIKLKRDQRDCSVSGNGLGIRVVGGKEIPGSRGEIGAYIAAVIPGGAAEQTGKVIEGMQVLEWNTIPLTGKTYEEVQCIVGQPCAEAELCVRLDLNMLSDPERPQILEHQLQSSGQRSPGVDPKQLAAELQKVSQLQGPGLVGAPIGPGGLGVHSALERSALLHSGPGSAASSGVPSPGQPSSPAINKKQRHKIEVTRTPHPITGEIQLQINYDKNLGNLIVHVLQARNLAPRDNDGYSDPFVKVYLLPGRGQVMVVQNASADNKRRTKYAQKTVNPEWNQTVIYKNIHLEQLKKKTLEVTVWDYDRSSSNDFLGEVLIDLSNTAQLDNIPRWLPLREQSESIDHSRAHHTTLGPPGSGAASGPGLGHMPGHMLGSGTGPSGMGHASGQGDSSHDSPKNSVIKSRSHGIFPDPAKDMQMLPLEKSHSSPGSSKSSSEGQLLSHGPSRSQSKSSVTQAHLEDAGMAIAAAEAAVQQSRLQPRTGHRLADVSSSVVLSAPSLVGDAYGDEDGAGSGVDSAIFQVPRMKAIPNGTDKHHIVTPENEGGKVQVMGEIKVALKKEVKTEGDQLVLEILQCRNITYKFKSPDHLPDLYVKLYVVNVATQKRIIKKKTRVCRHDREPSFNETFRFPLNPTGHSIQLFLVSNGGKFMKKTLIGEAYIWLDKVDMRKRVVSWHKLLASTALVNP